MSDIYTNPFTAYSATPGVGDWNIRVDLTGLDSAASTLSIKATISAKTVNGGIANTAKDSTETTATIVVPIIAAAGEAVVVTVQSNLAADSTGVTVTSAATRVKVDVEAISGSSTAADNLELQYDTTGLTGGTFPATQAQVGASVVKYPDAGRMMAGASEANTYAKLAVSDDDYWSCTDPDNSNPLEMCVYVNAADNTFPDAVLIEARYNAQNNRRVHVFAANVDDVAAVHDATATATDASPSVLTHSVAGSFAGLTLAGYDIYITSGTNATAGFYTIASHDDDTITLDRNCSSNGAVSVIDFIVMVWDQISNDANAILHKTGLDGEYEYPLGVAYMTTDDNEVFLRFSDEGQGTFKTSYDLRLDQVGVITKSLAGGSVSAEVIAAAVHNELDDHLQHIPLFTGEMFHVSPNGNDSFSGHVPAFAFLTLGHAISTAPAGAAIKVMAGIYTEVGLDLNKSGLELHGEIGACLAPASGSALTISATHCRMDTIEVRPAAGEVGFDFAAGSSFSRIDECLQTTSGGTAMKVDSTVSDIHGSDLQFDDYTSVGLEINGPDCLFSDVRVRGTGGASTGFKLGHTNAHHTLITRGVSIDNQANGFETVVGADENVAQSCAVSETCGGTDGKTDAGTNNAWRDFMVADVGTTGGLSVLDANGRVPADVEAIDGKKTDGTPNEVDRPELFLKKLSCRNPESTGIALELFTSGAGGKALSTRSDGSGGVGIYALGAANAMIIQTTTGPGLVLTGSTVDLELIGSGTVEDGSGNSITGPSAPVPSSPTANTTGHYLQVINALVGGVTNTTTANQVGFLNRSGVEVVTITYGSGQAARTTSTLN